MKRFFSQMFQDIDGYYSSKRFMVLISMVILIVTWSVNIFYGLQVTEFIFEGFLYIVVVGLGVTAAEKFSRKGESLDVTTVVKEEEILK